LTLSKLFILFKAYDYGSTNEYVNTYQHHKRNGFNTPLPIPELFQDRIGLCCGYDFDNEPAETELDYDEPEPDFNFHDLNILI
jgi:hypothetical protein